MNFLERGPVAQLGARFNRTEEAEGSNPPGSTERAFFGILFFYVRDLGNGMEIRYKILKTGNCLQSE
jgi:hypothetical protein